MGNNYGTLNADYDAGYDDARGEAFEEAITRIQKMRDDARHDQLAWYVGRLMDLPGVGYEEAANMRLGDLEKLWEKDDWRSWEIADSEDIEIWEGAEGSIEAYNAVLDVLQSLAHGLEPAQGS